MLPNLLKFMALWVLSPLLWPQLFFWCGHMCRSLGYIGLESFTTPAGLLCNKSASESLRKADPLAFAKFSPPADKEMLLYRQKIGLLEYLILGIGCACLCNDDSGTGIDEFSRDSASSGQMTSDDQPIEPISDISIDRINHAMFK